jgi:hypothetical protein
MWKWRDPALAHALVAMLDETRNSDLFLTWDKWSLVNTLSSFRIQVTLAGRLGCHSKNRKHGPPGTFWSSLTIKAQE